jgi:hypothetical protein
VPDSVPVDILLHLLLLFLPLALLLLLLFFYLLLLLLLTVLIVHPETHGDIMLSLFSPRPID